MKGGEICNNCVLVKDSQYTGPESVIDDRLLEIMAYDYASMMEDKFDMARGNYKEPRHRPCTDGIFEERFNSYYDAFNLGVIHACKYFEEMK